MGYHREELRLSRVQLFQGLGLLALLLARCQAAEAAPNPGYQLDCPAWREHDVVGELSVAYCEPVGRYVMLYNSTRPRGIVMRWAAAPWASRTSRFSLV